MKTISRKRLRDELRESTRVAILNAAEAAFTQDHSVIRMEDIAREAGVAIGTLYNYFADRSALLAGLFEARCQETEEMLQDIIEHNQGKAIQEQLEYHFERTIEYINRHHAFFHAAWQFEEIRTLMVSKKSMKEMIIKYLHQITDEAVARGELRAEFATVYPDIIMGVAHGALVCLIKGRTSFDVKNVSHHITELFLDGAKQR